MFNWKGIFSEVVNTCSEYFNFRILYERKSFTNSSICSYFHLHDIEFVGYSLLTLQLCVILRRTFYIFVLTTVFFICRKSSYIFVTKVWKKYMKKPTGVHFYFDLNSINCKFL